MSMRSLRCLGSCALDLCSVACGRVDAMYEIGFGGCAPQCSGPFELHAGAHQCLVCCALDLRSVATRHVNAMYKVGFGGCFTYGCWPLRPVLLLAGRRKDSMAAAA